MAHTIFLGRFAKKLNSTKQPDYSSWSGYSCTFKETMSIYTPTLTLQTSYSALISNNYNYAAMMGCYYWIRDIVSLRTNVVEVSLVLDPFAAYKSDILATPAFIEYGFNTFDAGAAATRIADQRIAINTNPTMYGEYIDPSAGIISPTAGCYIVQAVGNDPAGEHRGLAAFALTAAQLARLMTSVNTQISNDVAQIMALSVTPQEIANRLMEFSINNELLAESALSAIQSVIWLPLDISGATGAAGTKLYLGNFDSRITATMLTANAIYRATPTPTITIPWPADDWKRKNCQMLLYVPFFGTIPIPVDQCVNETTLSFEWTAEYFSGSISLRILAGAYTVFTGSTNISTSMGVGRSMVSSSALASGTIQKLGGELQAAGGIVDMTAGAAGTVLGMGTIGNAASAMLAGAQNYLSGYMQTVQPVISSVGSMGGMAAIGQSQLARLILLYYPPIEADAFQARYGHPVFRIDTPAAGFCKTRGFSVSGNMPGPYAAAINAAMDGGMYIE